MLSDMPCLDCGQKYQLSASEASGDSWQVRTHVCGDARESEELRYIGKLRHRALLKQIRGISE